MNNQDIRTLKLLEEIEKNHVASQRDLSKKLNISLGLVNAFIKRLAQKGYFKITTIPKNRVKYILTPKGVAEKTRLTYQYIQYSFDFYKRSRKELRKLFKTLLASGVKRVAFYGANDLAEIAFISLQETSIKLVGIVDDKNAGKKFLGHLVYDSSMLGNLSFDRILVTSLKLKNSEFKNITDKGILSSKIIILE